ncbi:hypothetical protein GV054_09045 [Marinomonas mediterranea]|jgi:hypothetical protein|uniref:Uncharacterized protein n=1 Tax=Marinomonas mediterranea (strain ATCC 700492 / JCM 21426 / NBRC 103028 / MMB-1) TaxID=717774 RepID=F2K1E7_MARM1|nr:hypothetical protein [Marinomonas mediterranea]ADZ91078.1 hypothetical protein Marme_1822 [Marinomonas mediterranea MMB-1]WCN13142.1 hypothetical protein GV054_09045 [Marinomonas mediterranea]WCN17213.1 hypothetical protein GV053_09210 [Marinomonas mediterranea MMB-1]
MRWKDKDKLNTLGSLSWRIINDHVTYLISSTADAGWKGVGNTGRICESLMFGVSPTFSGGGDSNAAMIRHIKALSVKDKGFSWLFRDLSRMQKLCLFAAVLAEGRRTIKGRPLSNARIAATLPTFAAELRLGPAHTVPSEKTFANNVSEGRKRFLATLEEELQSRLSEDELKAIA